MKHTLKPVGMLRLVGAIGLYVTLATAAFAGSGSGQGSVKQLTGKATSVTSASITVTSPNATLRCAARAGLKLDRFAGKRVTMACRMAEGRLVVKSVKMASWGKAARQKKAPAPTQPSQIQDDPADDDDDDDADDDNGLDVDDEDCDDDGPGDDDCDDDDDDDDEDEEEDEDDEEDDEEDDDEDDD